MSAQRAKEEPSKWAEQIQGKPVSLKLGGLQRDLEGTMRMAHGSQQTGPQALRGMNLLDLGQVLQKLFQPLHFQLNKGDPSSICLAEALTEGFARCPRHCEQSLNASS